MLVKSMEARYKKKIPKTMRKYNHKIQEKNVLSNHCERHLYNYCLE